MHPQAVQASQRQRCIPTELERCAAHDWRLGRAHGDRGVGRGDAADDGEHGQ